MQLVLRSFVRSLSQLLTPLNVALGDDVAMQPMLRQLGILAHDTAALQTLQATIAALQQQLDMLADTADLSLDTLEDAQAVCRQALSVVRACGDAGGAFPGMPGIGPDLVHWLVGRWLRRQHPLLRQVAVLLTLIDAAEFEPPGPAVLDGDRLVRGEQRLDRFALDRLGALLRNPVTLLREAYLNDLATDADAAVVADRLLPRVGALLRLLGMQVRYGVASGDRAALGEAGDLLAHTLVAYKDDPLAGLGAEAGVVLSFSPASRGDLGLVAAPFGSLGGAWQFGMWRSEVQLDAGLGLVAFGRHGATLLPGEGQPELPLRLAFGATRDGDDLVMGNPAGTRLALSRIDLRGALDLGEGVESLRFSADAPQATLVLAEGGGDGFLASVLPADGLRVDFDLGLSWASGRGFSLRGGAGLSVELPLSRRLGGVLMRGLVLRLMPQDDGVVAEASITVQAGIGPVQATLKGLGLKARLDTRAADGNLGVAELSLGLTRPAGVGLALDTGGLLSGAGYLYYDAATGTYAGALQASLRGGLTLSAYGLLTTRAPDGGAGYSLLVFINAEGFKPVPLGFGFMLRSLGGMLGLHRRLDADALRAGLQAGTLAQLLFPRDPVANAPALMQALATAFPAQPGSHLVGLMARISWFEPVLVWMDLALILQLGTAQRLLALARVTAQLPTADNDLIRLHLDAVGVLDFDAGEFSADAVLVDSRLARRFPVTGAAALRANWSGSGQGTSFVLAVGGMHPRYTPPAGLPPLERVAVSLGGGRSPRLTAAAYFALTANTLQFGARVHLYAEALGFSVDGDVGFDALITLVPFHFLVDFRASVQLKRGSRNLFKVGLDGSLEGPLPLRLRARARFEILWISFSVRLDFTLADGDRDRPPVTSVNLAAELTRALTDPVNWRARPLPGGGPGHGVALGAAPVTPGLVLDPLGQLELRQQVVPLNTARDIDTCAGLPVTGPRRFRLTARVDGRAGTPLTSAFAPARYFSMSDDDKLAAPSFEDMDAGLLLGAQSSSFDAAAVVAVPLDYEQVLLDDLPEDTAFTATTHASSSVAAVTATRYVMPATVMQHHCATGAAARAPVRQQGAARYRGPDAPAFARLHTPRWQVVHLDDTLPAFRGVGGTAAAATAALPAQSWTASMLALGALNRGRRRAVLQPLHEALA